MTNFMDLPLEIRRTIFWELRTQARRIQVKMDETPLGRAWISQVQVYEYTNYRINEGSRASLAPLRHCSWSLPLNLFLLNWQLAQEAKADLLWTCNTFYHIISHTIAAKTRLFPHRNNTHISIPPRINIPEPVHLRRVHLLLKCHPSTFINSPSSYLTDTITNLTTTCTALCSIPTLWEVGIMIELVHDFRASALFLNFNWQESHWPHYYQKLLEPLWALPTSVAIKHVRANADGSWDDVRTVYNGIPEETFVAIREKWPKIYRRWRETREEIPSRMLERDFEFLGRWLPAYTVGYAGR